MISFEEFKKGVSFEVSGDDGFDHITASVKCTTVPRDTDESYDELAKSLYEHMLHLFGTEA